MALRENEVRRLDLEFEAYRIGANLVEGYLQDPSSIAGNDEVLGFGLYGPRGDVLVRKGSAPSSIESLPSLSSIFTILPGGKSAILLRPLGGGESQPPMRGMMRGQGPGMTRQSQGFPQGAVPMPGFQDRPGRSQMRYLWLELPTSGLLRSRTVNLGAAALISTGLVGLYFLLLLLYRRNAELRERESKNGELIQLGEAARTIAHEIKNPLAVIRIQTATLRRLGLPVDSLPKVDLIDEEVGRLAALSDRIRDFLKSGAGDEEAVELEGFLLDYCDRYAGAVPGPIFLTLPQPETHEAWVRVDPEKLSQALDNLVRNAFDALATIASPNEASIDPLAPAGSESPKVEISLALKGKHWHMEISDNGPGISREAEARLFEPFFTTKEKGSGIGLALARKFAVSAGGGLEYRSGHESAAIAAARPGAVFNLVLPAELRGKKDGGRDEA